MFWLWVLSVPAVALALLSLRGERKRARFFFTNLARPNSWLPPASVIVPVKGEDEGLRENLASLATLDYPDYELIVVAREARDIPPGVLPSRVRVVLARGREDPRTSEKIQNLIAAVRSARKNSTVFAFADSDGRVGVRWLRSLVEPLASDEVGAATGYRWYTPRRARFWPLVRSVWNAAIAGTLGPGAAPFTWGGATAIRKEIFFALRVPDVWTGEISSDYSFAAVVRSAGLRIAFAPGGMVASADGTTARDFFAWARRQLMFTRFYRPRLWRPALAAHVVYCVGMTASVAAWIAGNQVAPAILALQLLPGMIKGWSRARLARAALPQFDGWFRRWGWIHAWSTPLVTWIWLFTLLSSAFGHTVEWRGRRYELYNRGSP